MRIRTVVKLLYSVGIDQTVIMCWPFLGVYLSLCLRDWRAVGKTEEGRHLLAGVEKAQPHLTVGEGKAPALIQVVNFATGLGVQRTLRYYRQGSA